MTDLGDAFFDGLELRSTGERDAASASTKRPKCAAYSCSRAMSPS